MANNLALASLLLLASVFGAARAAAQDLVITNARIVVGNGMVINQGASPRCPPARPHPQAKIPVDKR